MLFFGTLINLLLEENEDYKAIVEDFIISAFMVKGLAFASE